MGKPVETFPMDAACLTLLAIITLLTTSASVGFRSFNNVGASFDCNASDDADAAPRLSGPSAQKAASFYLYSLFSIDSFQPLPDLHPPSPSSSLHRPFTPKKAQNTSAVQGAGVLLEVI